jgi:hypothetical protein
MHLPDMRIAEKTLITQCRDGTGRAEIFIMRARRRGGSTRGFLPPGRLHMRLLLGASLTLAVAIAGPVAAAWPHDVGGGAFFRVQAPRQGPGGMQRQPQQRDMRAAERQPQRRPDGRFTEEERRNLHRDLDRANREIYKGR